MRLIKENINWSKLFLIIYIIVAIIVLIIMWKPASNPEISKYKRLEEQEVDKLATEEYVMDIRNAIYHNDMSFLYKKLSDSYKLYNKLDENSVKSIFNGKIDYSKLSVNNVEKLEYGNTNVYRVSLGKNDVNKKINIIEKYGKNWNYTFDDFFNFQITDFSGKYKDIDFMIDSIYQTFGSIQITCYIQNRTSNDINIHMEQEDSVMLKLSTNDIVKISNSEIDESSSKVNRNTFSSRTLKYNIDLENQYYIEQIIFKNLEINGEKGSLIINLDI